AWPSRVVGAATAAALPGAVAAALADAGAPGELPPGAGLGLQPLAHASAASAAGSKERITSTSTPAEPNSIPRVRRCGGSPAAAAAGDEDPGAGEGERGGGEAAVRS